MSYFCERKGNFNIEHFDRRSFRWKQSGRARVLVGCPRGEWSARKKVCKVGTVAYKILTPTTASGSCRRRGKKIRKG